MGVRRFRQFLAEPTLSKVPNATEGSNGKGNSAAKANVEIVIKVSMPPDCDNAGVVKLLKNLAAELSEKGTAKGEAET
jgi:hypothetical protein